ncbi:MAG: hypothetical protein FWD18_08830 [Micrococcales bacterium]|nr:hypothetical protein [Micrococcales bacterium]
MRQALHDPDLLISAINRLYTAAHELDTHGSKAPDDIDAGAATFAVAAWLGDLLSTGAQEISTVRSLGMATAVAVVDLNAGNQSARATITSIGEVL